MKKTTKILFLFGLLLLISSCGDNVKTPIGPVDPNIDPDLEIEIVSPRPDEFVYSNGYDSTGIVAPVSNFANLILVNGIVNSYEGVNKSRGIGEVVFYDKNSPVFAPRGRGGMHGEGNHGAQIGYKTRYIGRVSFDEDTAKIVKATIGFVDRGVKRDTTLGVKHIHNFGLTNKYLDNFPYDDKIDFKLERLDGGETTFTIPTPKKLNAEAFFRGSLKNKDLQIKLNWDKSGGKKIEIIVGGIVPDKSVIPFVRFKSNDTGSVELPARVLNDLPIDRFDKIVITLIRKSEKKITNNNLLIDNFIAAQSIHNIVYTLD